MITNREFHAACFAALLVVVSALAAQARITSDQAEVRQTIDNAFDELKAGRYDELYDLLPSVSQRRISRERFTDSLRRSQSRYELDRLEIGRVYVAGDLAFAEATMYGRLAPPLEGEGKISSPLYLVREDGRWRITLGDRSSVQPLLDANPAFARKYPLHPPRVYIKRDGRWVEFNLPRRPSGT